MEYEPIEAYDPVEGEADESELGFALWKAFNVLEQDGYFVGHNWTCCDTCGWAEIPEDQRDRAVFYTMQADERALETGILHISWAGDAKAICASLRSAGLVVFHDGLDTSKIVARLT